MHSLLLSVIVFFSGAIIMSLELCGSRLFAPFLGSSIYVWTSLIGVILATLSAGYYWGGKRADKGTSPELLSGMLCAAAAGTLLVSFLHYPVLTALSRLSFDIRILSTFGACLLFALPAFFFATISPIAFRFSINSVEHAGSKLGYLSALSTIGSIFGTFITGFVLFETIGTDQIILSLCLLSILLSLLALLLPGEKIAKKRKPLIISDIILICALVAVWFFTSGFLQRSSENGLRILDGKYHRILILEHEDENGRRRSLVTDPSGIQSTILLDAPKKFNSAYGKAFDAVLKQHKELQRVALLGGGALSYPKHFTNSLFPDPAPKDNLAEQQVPIMDIVEIDPLMTKVAKEYFFYEDHPRLNIYHADARRFFSKQETIYDVILLDVFRSSPEMPFHLATREYFQILKKALKKEGTLAINVIASLKGDGAKMTEALRQTLLLEFAEVQVLQVSEEREQRETQNLVLIASVTPRGEKFEYPSPLKDVSEEFEKKQVSSRSVLTFSDQFAPIEQLMRANFKAMREQSTKKEK